MVDESALPAKRTLDELEVPKSTFYGWYQRYKIQGFDGLADRSSGLCRFWYRIPDSECEIVVALALKSPEKTPRKLAIEITDKEGYFNLRIQCLSHSEVF